MAINAELFDGTILEFPDGTDPSVIQATARRVTLERQMSQREPRRDDLGEVQPQGSAAYEAVSKVADFARPYVEPVTDYVTEQASMLAGTAQKGYANLKMAAKQSQVAGLMELQEARKSTYGSFENMPPEEQQNFIKAQKAIEEKLGEVANLGVEKKAIDKKYGVRASTKAFNELSQSKEYQEGSFLDKMGMIGSKLSDDPFGIITDLGIESMPQSLAVAATAVAARTGQLNPKIAAGLGGSSSAMMEFGNAYAQLREEGLDHKEAWEKAGVKSGIVGLFDAASFYTAGKAAGNIVNNLQKGAVKETVKEEPKPRDQSPRGSKPTSQPVPKRSPTPPSPPPRKQLASVVQVVKKRAPSVSRSRSRSSRSRSSSSRSRRSSSSSSTSSSSSSDSSSSSSSSGSSSSGSSSASSTSNRSKK